MKHGDEHRGEKMHALARLLFPICRSITGDGVRETLSILQKRIPLSIHEVKSGTKAFDWTVPKEWNIRAAYIEDASGKKVIDFNRNNLHVVGYSTPVDAKMTLEELEPHLHSLPAQPDAIPYITSYYKPSWGFCLTHNDRKKMRPGTYHVVIQSELRDGSLTYGELIIPGKSTEEVFVSTYICHPSMANNELSGPVVATFLAEEIMRAPRRYTYRFVFIPETIGSIVYLARHAKHMKRRVVAGFNLTCVGDERAYSYLPSRAGDTLADKVIKTILGFRHPGYITWSFLDRGSDERQYCSPLIDLPVASVMRSKYGTYPEYHTSLDDLSLVTPRGLQGSFDVMNDCMELLERNYVYVATVPCEPQLGKRGLYATDAKTINTRSTRTIVDILAYADGTHDLAEISSLIAVVPKDMYETVDRLEREKLLRKKRVAGAR